MFNKKGKKRNEWLSIWNDVKCPTMLISLFGKSINLVQEEGQTSWQNKQQAKCNSQSELQRMYDVHWKDSSQGSSVHPCSLAAAGKEHGPLTWWQFQWLPLVCSHLQPRTQQFPDQHSHRAPHITPLIRVLHLNHPRATVGQIHLYTVIFTEATLLTDYWDRDSVNYRLREWGACYLADVKQGVVENSKKQLLRAFWIPVDWSPSIQCFSLWFQSHYKTSRWQKIRGMLNSIEGCHTGWCAWWLGMCH